MNLNRSRWWILILIIIAVIASFLIFYFYQKIQKSPTTARQFKEPIPVKVISAEQKDLSYIIGATGYTKEFSSLKIITNIAAPVKTVKAELGEIINKDQILLEFDETLLLSELNSVKAKFEEAKLLLNNTKLTLDRVNELYQQNLIAKKDVEQAQNDYAIANSNYENARYQLDKIQYNLNYLNLQAPITGAILDRTVNPKETPPLKASLFTIGIIDPIFMLAKVPEQNVGDIAIGQTAEVVFDAYPNLTHTGKIKKIEAQVDINTRYFLAYIELDNKDFKLKPGLTGFAKITFKKTGLTIPNLSIINPTGQRATVFIIDSNNIAQLREIKIGIINEEYSEVVSGLKDGERIVAVGMRDLRENDKVRIMHEVF